MDTTAFNQAKDDVKKQLDTILSEAGDDLKALAQKNLEQYMERVRLLEASILKGELNEAQAKLQLQMEKNTLGSFLLAEKNIGKEKAIKITKMVGKKLIEIAVSQGIKLILAAL